MKPNVAGDGKTSDREVYILFSPLYEWLCDEGSDQPPILSLKSICIFIDEVR